ncbi:hypothetical protein [Accumulibacter sp.]|uniref:hypothetical protein n=1 Tax=Accumulibacter sp. TaxID=2053492 RepID=UPI001AC4131B|nr:hypothetical protein [Accumulibacter sp.]MBN8498508.1 hypothetical protein [Accumulibacter sp.]
MDTHENARCRAAIFQSEAKERVLTPSEMWGHAKCRVFRRQVKRVLRPSIDARWVAVVRCHAHFARYTSPWGLIASLWRRHLKIKTEKSGRQRAGSVQMKIWLPEDLKNEFASLCAVQGVCASVVLRGLLAAYVQRAAGAQHGHAPQR